MHPDSASFRVRPLQPWFAINAAEDYLKKNVSRLLLIFTVSRSIHVLGF
ncbi:hypothetical protein [Pectobacterium parmentieri]|uniref:Transcriptional regulator, AraC family n=1 Tax=Pectobacterium parmentieri TaxID=1905730 RepID=A0A0H3HZ29_PECPM|nr:hypothetical protein [Pectobacterium parmentieri]ACX86350.1 transcriptional regulator, AraC family [Pectobacterium parmentieri WPP163]AFI88664.1 Transcriptional regulator, AraC family [Pectobacterium parmentieri]POW28308.1 transcriptional regulator, AraC family [Pectobacterium parmentieri]